MRRRHTISLLLMGLSLPSFCYVQNACLKRTSSTPMYAAAAEQESEDNKNDEVQDRYETTRRPVPLESPMHVVRRPRYDKSQFSEFRENRWKFRMQVEEDPPPEFPSSVEDVAEAAVDAIVGTIEGTQKNDPNVVLNSLEGSNVLGRRPVRHPWDKGRIGVEIDGAASLFPKATGLNDARALRHITLLLATKLSEYPWNKTEAEPVSSSCPVAVYFNTIKQALAASRGLQTLKRAFTEENNGLVQGPYDNITIHYLGEDNDIPDYMKSEIQLKDRHKLRRKPRNAGLASGSVEPHRGVVIVVQPTDFNDEYRPPGPAIGSVEAFQRLIARASAHSLPVVVVSPRFAVFTHGWDQSGYQQAATYGGNEPPKGPTPWVMRDFTPPAFCWIGNACRLSPPRSNIFLDSAGNPCRFTDLSLLESVMMEGHAWHIFARRECSCRSVSSSSSFSGTQYQYIASTSTHSGRPTRDILLRIFSEFVTF